MKINTKPKIKISISQADWDRINMYVKLSDIEISGFGLIKNERIKDKYMVNNKIVLEKLLPLPKQENTPTTTEVKCDDLEQFIQQEVPEYKDRKRVGLWWHSHVDMGAFWSSTDEQNIDEWSKSPILISIVLNKRGDYKIRYDMLTPHKHTCEDVELEIVRSDDLEKECATEIEAKCKSPSYHRENTSVIVDEVGYRWDKDLNAYVSNTTGEVVSWQQAQGNNSYRNRYRNHHSATTNDIYDDDDYPSMMSDPFYWRDDKGESLKEEIEEKGEISKESNTKDDRFNDGYPVDVRELKKIEGRESVFPTKNSITNFLRTVLGSLVAPSLVYELIQECESLIKDINSHMNNLRDLTPIFKGSCREEIQMDIYFKDAITLGIQLSIKHVIKDGKAITSLDTLQEILYSVGNDYIENRFYGDNFKNEIRAFSGNEYMYLSIMVGEDLEDYIFQNLYECYGMAEDSNVDSIIKAIEEDSYRPYLFGDDLSFFDLELESDSISNTKEKSK